MWEVVLLTGLLITGTSIYLMVRTESALRLVDIVFATRWIYLAALLRLMLGAALIHAAPAVRFSPAITAIGWLMALGGLVLVVVPAPAVARMAAWFGRLSPAMSRLWLSTAVLFGLFLIYAALV